MSLCLFLIFVFGSLLLFKVERISKEKLSLIIIYLKEGNIYSMCILKVYCTVQYRQPCTALIPIIYDTESQKLKHVHTNEYPWELGGSGGGCSLCPLLCVSIRTSLPHRRGRKGTSQIPSSASLRPASVCQYRRNIGTGRRGQRSGQRGLKNSPALLTGC